MHLFYIRGNTYEEELGSLENKGYDIGLYIIIVYKYNNVTL